ncbi:MAG: hypothetical protein ACYC6Y_24635, partial [Thermoguttaceae bacterium]
GRLPIGCTTCRLGRHGPVCGVAMGHLAKVTSIDVIERFAAAMKCFGDDAKTALDGVDMEVRRALHWIQREQKDYWTQQIRRGWDEVNIARKELERKLMFYPGDDRPSCHDERLALEAAKRRLRLAQEKVEAVKRWSHRAEREVNEYIGAVQVLRRWMEFDLPQAQADLARMGRALEDYVALESSAGPVFPDQLGSLIGSPPATAAAPPDLIASPNRPETPPGEEGSPLPPEASENTAVPGDGEPESVPTGQEKVDG